ncbi:hypothetical protein BKP64_14555 [Marinobacter salinus]|uniref:Uncharacterized protein n=1 Tax=Marinobacter salinus TaxID=1874317 RepID=A0A1D9GNS2_9GAMM|nr:hypothetical protein BKP64_14555 [Marinobacter salinus]
MTLPVLGAIDEVIIDHSGRLHKGINDRRANKIEAGSFQLTGHGFRFRGTYRYLIKVLPLILYRLAINKRPQKLTETDAFFPEVEKSSGIPDDGVDFQAVADNSGVCHQFCDLVILVSHDFFRVEIIVGLPVPLLLAEDGQPAQPRLLAVQAQFFEKCQIVIFWSSPNRIVIVNI